MMAAHEIIFNNTSAKELLSEANKLIDGFNLENDELKFNLNELNRIKDFIDIVRRDLITSQKTLTDLKYLNLIYYDRFKDRIQYFEED